MISISRIRIVPSCSNGRKRRNDEDIDEEGIKIPRGTFNFVLESESDISNSEEDAESILSVQNKSTDFAKDTSDTSSKTSRMESEAEEYELASLTSEQEHPFHSDSSTSDLEEGREKLKIFSKEGSSSSLWADNSSDTEASSRTHRQGIKPVAKSRTCLKCKAPTEFVHFCHRCYQVRKNFFPPRPTKRLKKKCLKQPAMKKPPQLIEEEEKNDSGFGSGLSQEASECPRNSTEKLCNICLEKPIDAGFLHCSMAHIYACYKCSMKAWLSCRGCPICRKKVGKVIRIS